MRYYFRLLDQVICNIWYVIWYNLYQWTGHEVDRFLENSFILVKGLDGFFRNRSVLPPIILKLGKVFQKSISLSDLKQNWIAAHKVCLDEISRNGSGLSCGKLPITVKWQIGLKLILYFSLPVEGQRRKQIENTSFPGIHGPSISTVFGPWIYSTTFWNKKLHAWKNDFWY